VRESEERVPRKKSLRDRFEEFLDELDEDDDEPRARKRRSDSDDDDVITLRGPAARKMLGLLEDEEKKPDEKPGDEKKPDEKPDEKPDRGKGYFTK
jgi:hypothetical protein